MSGPPEITETLEMKDRVLDAIQGLSEREREVTTLFYINGYSQNEIGAFLDVPTKTVKSRLHTARNHLRERMMDMVKEHLHEQRPSRDDAFTVRVSQHVQEIEELCTLLVEYAGRARRDGICSLRDSLQELPQQYHLLKVVLDHLCTFTESSTAMNRDTCIMKALLFMMQGKKADEVKREIRYHQRVAPLSAQAEVKHQIAQEKGHA